MNIFIRTEQLTCMDPDYTNVLFLKSKINRKRVRVQGMQQIKNTESWVYMRKVSPTRAGY